MLLKENYADHVKSAKSWFFVFLILIGISYLSVKYLELEIIESLLLLLPFLLIAVLPGVLAQIWYYRKSRKIKIEFKDFQLTYSQGNNSISVLYEDIDFVVCNRMASYDTGRYTAGLEQFWNLQFFTNDGKVFFVTCLMYSNLEKLIDFLTSRGLKVEINKGYIGFSKKKLSFERSKK